MIRGILRNMNAFVDGTSYAGQIEEFTPPKLAIKTEETRLGGMDAPVEIDMGMEKIEAEFTLASVAAGVIKLFGLGAGQQRLLVLRGALQSEDGAVTPVIITMRGQFRELDPGTWKPGEASKMKCVVALRYYKLVHGASTLIEIDVDNMKRVVDGVDQLQQMRAALGV